MQKNETIKELQDTTINETLDLLCDLFETSDVVIETIMDITLDVVIDLLNLKIDYKTIETIQKTILLKLL